MNRIIFSLLAFVSVTAWAQEPRDSTESVKQFVELQEVVIRGGLHNTRLKAGSMITRIEGTPLAQSGHLSRLMRKTPLHAQRLQHLYAESWLAVRLESDVPLQRLLLQFLQRYLQPPSWSRGTEEFAKGSLAHAPLCRPRLPTAQPRQRVRRFRLQPVPSVQPLFYTQTPSLHCLPPQCHPQQIQRYRRR